MTQYSLLKGNPFKALMYFTLPILFALLLQIAYSTADMLIVGNFSSVQDVSAVATGSQLITTITSLCSGLATGSTILIGQNIGKGKSDSNAKVIGNSVMVFLAIAVIITVVLIVFNRSIVAILNTPNEAIEQTSLYIFYCSLGIPMIFLYNILSSIFRGLGDSKTALITVGIACTINIVADLLLVGVFNMGAQGAAIATASSQTISVVLSVIIANNKKLITINLDMFRIHFSCIKRILILGVPIAIQSVLVNFSFLAITVIVNQFGVVYSASVGLVEKLIGFVMLVPISFMQSTSVFVAQNSGAAQHGRIKTGIIASTTTSLFVCVITAYISFFHGEILLKLFSNDLEVVATAKIYLQAYAFDVLLVSVLFNFIGFFNGYGKTMFVMIQGVFSAIAIRITLVYLFSLVTPVSLFLIGLASPIATIVQIALCIVYYYYLKKSNNLY